MKRIIDDLIARDDEHAAKQGKIWIVSVWAVDGGQRTFEGHYGPYTEGEALALEADLNSRPRWDSYMAVSNKLTTWED